MTKRPKNQRFSRKGNKPKTEKGLDNFNKNNLKDNQKQK